MANIIGGSIGAGKAILNDYTLGVEDIYGGHRLTITRGSEVQTMDIMDGKNGNDGKDGAPGAVQTVNGEAPDESGNVQVSGLPDGAGANMQLVTNADGTAKWEDRLAYTNTIIQTMIEEQTVTTVEKNGFYYTQLSSLFKPEIGKTYTVNFDGTEYLCTLSDFNGIPYLANISIVNGENDTGEPFLILQLDRAVLLTHSAETHTVSVVGPHTFIKQIDMSYIPDIPDDKLPKMRLRYYFDRQISDLDEAHAMTTEIVDEINKGRTIDVYVKTSKTGTIGFSNCVGANDGSYKDEQSGTYKPMFEFYFTKATRTLRIYNDKDYEIIEHEDMPQSHITLKSSTVDSTKKFKITVDDSGTISATEVT